MINRDRSKCETCRGAGVYPTGAFVGDDADNLRPVLSSCPDCDLPGQAFEDYGDQNERFGYYF